MENEIKNTLSTIVHPETGVDLVTGEMVERIAADDEKITVVLRLAKPRDPFAPKIRQQVLSALGERFPAYASRISLIVKEAAPRAAQPERRSHTDGIARVVAVASGKGGVGKSTVTANLALTLRNMGYRVGILDADIYGPSMPKMFGVEGYVPDAERTDAGEDLILPAEAMEIRLMSIGFFIRPDDALIWRDAMAANALRQMIHQTKWGTLDFLLVDLPPGTGGVHLSVLSELKVDGAVIVSTPQQMAVADVRRGVEMFRTEKIEVPVLGVVENMAWFTPRELPQNRYYLFGRGGAKAYAEANGVPFLGEVPIILSVMEGGEEGRPAVGTDPDVEQYYRHIAQGAVENLMRSVDNPTKKG